VEPYSLFPLDEYFHGSVRTAPARTSRTSPLPRIQPALMSRSLVLDCGNPRDAQAFPRL
jgi:hypothetical protein